MGYVEEAHDTNAAAGANANAPPAYTCSLHYLSRPTGANCKALRLRYATPRSGGGNERRPREGLLKLYSGGNNNANLLRDAIDHFKSTACGQDSAAGVFRRLLVAAKDHPQPAGWQAEWDEAEAIVELARREAISRNAFNNAGIGLGRQALPRAAPARQNRA